MPPENIRQPLGFLMFSRGIDNRVGDTGGPGRPWTPSLFCVAKRKNGNKGKSRKDFKAETIKRLSLSRIKCYCFSHSRAPRIQKVFLSANHGGCKVLTDEGERVQNCASDPTVKRKKASTSVLIKVH